MPEEYVNMSLSVPRSHLGSLRISTKRHTVLGKDSFFMNLLSSLLKLRKSSYDVPGYMVSVPPDMPVSLQGNLKSLYRILKYAWLSAGLSEESIRLHPDRRFRGVHQGTSLHRLD